MSFENQLLAHFSGHIITGLFFVSRLTPEQLDGSPITLKFVKFQNVQNMQFFFKDNQGLSLIGNPISTTNMNDFKRVAGKKGHKVGFRSTAEKF